MVNKSSSSVEGLTMLIKRLLRLTFRVVIYRRDTDCTSDTLRIDSIEIGPLFNRFTNEGEALPSILSFL